MSGGAARLNVVQSAVSHLIGRLEDELGQQLFERKGRRIALTSVGAMFLEDAKRIVADVDRAAAQVRSHGEGRIGKLRIGCQSVACRRSSVGETLRHFRTQHPGVELEIRMGLSSELITALGDEIDGAFAFLIEDLPGYHATELQQDDWLLALPEGHPLLSREKIVLADLQGEPFIWFPRRVAPLIYDRMMESCRSGGLHPHIVQEAFDETMMLNLVSTGLGLCFLSQSVASISMPGVVLRRVEDFSLPQRFCFITRSGDDRMVLARMKGLIASVFDGGPTPSGA